MNVVVVLEHRFNRTPDGAIWTQIGFGYSFWARYLSIFDTVTVVARVRQVGQPNPSWQRSDGDRVAFAPVPHYLGPWQYLLSYMAVRRAIRAAIGPEDAVIIRISSPLAAVITPQLHHDKRPYGAEVVGDPYDVFAPGAMKHPLRPFFRWWFPRQIRQQCAKACGAAYVTEHALQRRYPAAPQAFTTHYSSIELDQSALAAAPRHPMASAGPTRLVSVGTLEQLYKAPDVLIDAVAACVREGLDLKLTLVGDGKHRPELVARVAALKLTERVCFRGQLPAGAAVRAELDRADLFVLPSRQEGLPRAMIEAMARALPCIGSTVGGIWELLPPEDMVPPGDQVALARKIREVAADPERMAAMSARNLAKAGMYTEHMLGERRNCFYRYVREQTETWLHERVYI